MANTSDIHDSSSVKPEIEPQSKPQRLIRLAEVKQRVGLSRASIYKRMSEGRFPKSRSLGSRCAVWVEAEIDDWIALVARK
ncbi:MAG: AlpA family transcriptional regulator [Sphingomonadaceae bacterium]|jgi:prophage regulatory protein|nr:AlpA family transcriptional regulator [Sphingomonadaceae bacterium]